MARALVFMVVLALAACGKTGPLYLPPARPAAPPAAHHGAGPHS
ncbi:MAG: LPS translocon maturation chaperone LptM [Acidiferrobacter sp.]